MPLMQHELWRPPVWRWDRDGGAGVELVVTKRSRRGASRDTGTLGPGGHKLAREREPGHRLVAGCGRSWQWRRERERWVLRNRWLPADRRYRRNRWQRGLVVAKRNAECAELGLIQLVDISLPRCSMLLEAELEIAPSEGHTIQIRKKHPPTTLGPLPHQFVRVWPGSPALRLFPRFNTGNWLVQIKPVNVVAQLLPAPKHAGDVRLCEGDRGFARLATFFVPGEKHHDTLALPRHLLLEARRH